MIVPSLIKAKLIKKTLLNTTSAEFVFQLENPKEWKTGQFAMIEIQDNQTPPIKRAYSIASSYFSSPNIKFLIKRVENGRGTGWLFNTLQEGDFTNIMLPLGHMVLKEESTEKNANEILLIGTGIGAAPMFAFIEHMKELNFPIKTRFIFGTRYEEDLYFYEEMKELAKTYENFEFYPTVSRPSENWKETPGRADKIINNLDINFNNQDAYICGSPEVAKSLQTLLEELGTEKENIKMEAF